MKPLRMRLDLSRHCIETEIKRRHSRLVGRALKSMAFAESLEGEIELLRQALERFDFGLLRIRYPALAGHSMELVELESDERGEPTIRINGKPVEEERQETGVRSHESEDR
jgi:hypothetical protein